MNAIKAQPPSGGCVLKQSDNINHADCVFQPPSGGCVLKPHHRQPTNQTTRPAAFGRLCVETIIIRRKSKYFNSSRLRAAVC